MNRKKQIGQQGREQARTLDAGKLVFLDEYGSTIAFTRVYGRSRHPENG